jgi:predicted DNA-binding transcriptional regulator AlpA
MDETPQNEAFFTDKELRERWKCSQMKIWRLRDKGKLPKPIKIGGVGVNLTRVSEIKALEAA